MLVKAFINFYYFVSDPPQIYYLISRLHIQNGRHNELVTLKKPFSVQPCSFRFLVSYQFTHMHREATYVFRDSLKLRQKLLQRTTTYFKVVEFVKKDAIRYFTYDYELNT